LRKAASLSQAQLAERLGVPVGVVVALELGRVTPSDALLATLQTVLPVPAAMQSELARLRPRALDLGDPDVDLEPSTPLPPAVASPEVETPDDPPPAEQEPLEPVLVTEPGAVTPNETISVERTQPPAPDRPADLRSLRQRKGLSQKEMADMLGFSTATLSFCERGTKQLGADKAELLARIMDSLADITSTEFVGARLREKMQNREWTPEDLAEHSGVSLTTIHTSLEVGFDNAAREDIRRLFNALGNRQPLWRQTETGWLGPSDDQLAALNVPPPLFTALREGTMIPSDALYTRLQSLASPHNATNSNIAPG
jgi:transcriptional regulator with XRE-family HTH domain